MIDIEDIKTAVWMHAYDSIRYIIKPKILDDNDVVARLYLIDGILSKVRDIIQKEKKHENN